MAFLIQDTLIFKDRSSGVLREQPCAAPAYPFHLGYCPVSSRSTPKMGQNWCFKTTNDCSCGPIGTPILSHTHMVARCRKPWKAEQRQLQALLSFHRAAEDGGALSKANFSDFWSFLTVRKGKAMAVSQATTNLTPLQSSQLWKWRYDNFWTLDNQNESRIDSRRTLHCKL